MELHQAQALAATGRGLVEYTRGVLAALGHVNLADEIRVLAASRAVAGADLDKADNREDLFGPEPTTPEYQRARAYLDDVTRREDAAWAKVDALVAQAREVLGAADPFGMGQAS